jgi:hypothetical protein
MGPHGAAWGRKGINLQDPRTPPPGGGGRGGGGEREREVVGGGRWHRARSAQRPGAAGPGARSTEQISTYTAQYDGSHVVYVVGAM